MTRYGRDFDRNRWPDRGAGGPRGGWEDEGGGWGPSGEYGGMRSDAQGGRDGYGGGWQDAGRSGFGGGGGAYDREFDGGRSWNASGRGGAGPWETGGGWSGGGYPTGGGPGEDMGGYGRGGQGRPGYGSSSSYGAQGGGYGDRGYEGGRGFGGGQDYGYGEPSGRGGGYGRQEFGYGSDRGRTGGGQDDDLRRLRAADIMTENPECVTPDATLADAARKMRELDVGILPVVDSAEGRRLRGVVTDRDIAIRGVAEGLDARSTKVQDVMSTSVETANKNDSVNTVLELMQREQVRRVPITDREGRLVGIVAQADVATDLDGHTARHRVASTLEQISEPSGRGRGGGNGGMRASQDRSQGMGGRSGGMQAGQGGSTQATATGETGSDKSAS